jgi:hypothetical protein
MMVVAGKGGGGGGRGRRRGGGGRRRRGRGRGGEKEGWRVGKEEREIGRGGIEWGV